MKTTPQIDDIIPLLFHALRNYRRANLEEVGQLAELRLVQQKLQQGQNHLNAQSLHWSLCRVLEDAVQSLEAQDAESAELLRLRFFQGCSAAVLAQQFTLSESGFFYRQKRATQLLAHQLLTAEHEVSQPTAQHMLRQPVPVPKKQQLYSQHPPAIYAKIFGLEKQKQLLYDALNSSDGPWLITLVGMGGIGKSTLAQLGSSWVVEMPHYRHCIWLTFQQETYDLAQGRRQTVPGWENPMPSDEMEQARLALHYDQLVESIASHLGLANPPPSKSTSPQQARQTQLRTYLAEYPALIVIDNLESVAEYVELVQAVRSLCQPSKVLITSRYSIEMPDTLLLRLDELSWQESLGLLTFESELRGIAEVAAASPNELYPIYEVVGGNPLALKLLIGQLTLLPLRQVLQRLQQARKVGERTEYELYYYLYRTTWQLLSPTARELMLTMLVFPPQGTSWQDLLETSEMKTIALADAVKECNNRSLLHIVGWPDKIYSLHRLTYTFLMTDVLKWWS